MFDAKCLCKSNVINLTRTVHLIELNVEFRCCRVNYIYDPSDRIDPTYEAFPRNRCNNYKCVNETCGMYDF